MARAGRERRVAGAAKPTLATSFQQVIEGVGKRIDDIAGDQADLAVLVAGDIAGQAVYVDAERAASKAGSFWPIRAAMTPVSTSPAPPVAIPGLPVLLI